MGEKSRDASLRLYLSIRKHIRSTSIMRLGNYVVLGEQIMHVFIVPKVTPSANDNLRYAYVHTKVAVETPFT
jgi:hypothetical protein